MIKIVVPDWTHRPWHEQQSGVPNIARKLLVGLQQDKPAHRFIVTTAAGIWQSRHSRLECLAEPTPVLPHFLLGQATQKPNFDLDSEDRTKCVWVRLAEGKLRTNMRTAVGGNGNDGVIRLLQLLGLVVAGYGAYKALAAGKLTPHGVVAVAAFLAALRPELY